MADGFWTGLNQKLFFWSGWVFTVGGAIASLLIGREYWWIGWLVVLVGLIALMAFAYEKHREKLEAERRYENETRKLAAERDTAQHHAEDAELKLNRLSSDILMQLQAFIEFQSHIVVSRRILNHARFVARMVQLAQHQSKPISLRTFAKRAGELYVEGKLAQPALQFLEVDDRFVLDFKDTNALLTTSALLLVHQVDPAKEIVWFKVVSITGDEMAHVEALAEKQEVSAKGYSARPECDVSRYNNLSLAGIDELLTQIVDDMGVMRG